MEKKGQHTISKCYLEKFIDKDGLLWVLDKNDKIFPAKPEGILKEKHFYTITLPSGGGSFIIEDTLANIESKYARIYDTKLARREALTKEERGVIAVFVAAMLQRTKPQRESLRKMFTHLDKELEKWQEIFSKNPKAKEFYSGVPSSGRSFSRDDIKRTLEKLDEFHSVSMIETLPGIADIIFKMKWSLLITDNEEDGFITSDNPCALLRPESIKKYGHRAFGSSPGLVYKDIELSLPLSSKMALLTGWKIQYETYFPASHWFVRQINIRSLMYAKEKVITNNKKKLEEIRDKSIN